MSTPRPLSEFPSDTRGTFTFGTRIGLLFIFQVACISFLMVSGMLVAISWRTFRKWRRSQLRWPSNLHLFFISLLVSDLIQALGAMFDIKWVILAGIVEGPYCTAQGALKHIGDTGVALTTMAIAFQTFFIIVFRWKIAHSPRLGLGVLGAIWIFLALAVGIASAKQTADEPLYGNTRYWCWMRTPPYRGASIGLQYVWMWLTAFLSCILYGISWAVLKHRTHRDSFMEEASDQDGAVRMLWYPIIYTITVLPISVTRFIQFQHPDPPPFAATAFAGILLGSSGIFNVVLFALTRPALLSIPTVDDQEKEELSAFNDGLLAPHPVGSVSRKPDLHSTPSTDRRSQEEVWPTNLISGDIALQANLPD